jgi:sortase A
MSVATARPPAEARRKGSVGRRFVRGFGWTLMSAGVLLILFVVYQLFVTNVITDRFQDGLRQDLAERFQQPAGGGGGGPNPLPGEALGVIRIPAIGLDAAFVEGTAPEDLKKGPGHYDSTPMPGEGGNVGIAGHRTTYGKPFWALDELGAGDQILVRTAEGRFVYRVTWTRVVTPDRGEVLGVAGSEARDGSLLCGEVECLTLTTCHPRFSAAERLIVRGVLVGAPPGVEVVT